MKWIAVIAAAALGTGCKEHKPAPEAPPTAMPASAIKRAQDACNAYLAQVCACARTVPAMQQACELARAYPEALQVELDVAANPDSTRRDVRQTQGGVRNIEKTCIEEMAKLPAAGCGT